MEQRLSRRDLHCPVCRAEVDPAFLVCPVCTTRLRQSCRNCKQPLEALWQVCPYCETPLEPSAVEPLGQTQTLNPPTRRERSA
jgi:predicted amidophosphoribosyltransferase